MNKAKILRAFKSHRSVIGVACGLIGMGISMFTVGKATVKAVRIYDAETEKKGAPLTKKETFKATWKCYILPTTLLVGSTTSIIAGHADALKQNASMAAVCAATDAAFKNFKAKTEEVVGAEKMEEIKSTVYEDVAKAVVPCDAGVDGEHGLFIEYYSGQEIWSSKNDIKAIVNELNYCRSVGKTDAILLSDFLSELDIDAGVGDLYGWEEFIGVRLNRTTQDSKGRGCTIIEYLPEPKPLY